MGEFCSNYEAAKIEADKVDSKIIEALKTGRSFRVEAGAGSGKTYSLNKVIEWIQANKWDEFNQKKQNVVCITFTNAAVDVIADRLSNDSFIVPSTIHSFAWNAIKQYQSFLINSFKSDPDFQLREGGVSEIDEVNYTLGHRYIENGVLYLYHDDVLKLFCELLDYEKFRLIFSKKYPLILIDEYQDSYKPIIDRFVKYFIDRGKQPQFGFFGDAWQTIYQSNKACGLIENKNLEVIKKTSNFRSAPKIVDFLNKIRPELPQKSALDDFQGEIKVISCDDFTGIRRNDGNFKGELPTTELKNRLDRVIQTIKSNSPKEKIKVLMLTHKLLAAQQGYEKLLGIIDEGLKDKEDPFILFFMEKVEPVFNALSTNNTQQLFDALGITRYPILKKSDKEKWHNLLERLKDARRKKTIDVINVVEQTKLIPIPPKIEDWYRIYQKSPETKYHSDFSIRDFLELEYDQFNSAINFLYPDGFFSTEHGVKGEEFDNVIFVIGKGWTQYQFEKFAPMIIKNTTIPEDKKASYERNRNLFYVCCSRPKKRLFFLVTIPLDQTFKSFFAELVGEENIMTYKQFIN